MREMWCEGKVACGHYIVIYGSLLGRWPNAASPGRPDSQTYMEKFLYVCFVYP